MSTSRRYTIEIDSDETPYYKLLRKPPGYVCSFTKPVPPAEWILTPRPSPVITPEKIYEPFHKCFHLDYFCVSLKNKKRYIYVIFHEPTPRTRLCKYFGEHMFSIGVGIKIWKSAQFEGGKVVFEKGDRPTTPNKKRRLLTNKVLTPSTSDPGTPQIDMSDTILVGDKTYVRYINPPDPSPIFHAVWGTINDMWRPMFWVGPTSSIEPTPRRSVGHETTAKLLELQGDSCIICNCDVSIKSLNCDVDHIIPLHLGGSNSITNLQVLCVPCHRRKSAFESRKVRNNALVPDSIKLEPGSIYIARDDVTGSICEPIDFQERNPKDFLESGEDGLFKLVC